MALTEKTRADGKVTLDLSPMIDVVFLILIYFIVSIQMEPSLDDILKLPSAARSKKQEESRFQIYVLPSKILENGAIDPDSIGLIALENSGNRDSIFVALDDLPELLEARRQTVVDVMVQVANTKRAKAAQYPMNEEEIERLEKEIPLMIKGDANTFYARIFQVVLKAKEIKVSNFALVTSSESFVAEAKNDDDGDADANAN